MADALKAWHELRGRRGPEELVFVDEFGGALTRDDQAQTLRRHMWLRRHMRQAGLTRPELYEKGKNGERFGLHSFRRSFVTRSTPAKKPRTGRGGAAATSPRSCCVTGKLHYHLQSWPWVR